MIPETPKKRSKKGRKILLGVFVLGALIILIVSLSSGGGSNPNPNPGSPIGGNSPPAVASAHSVVYRVTGHGSLTYVTYNTDGMTTMNQEADVTLPWQTTLSLPTNRFTMLSVNAQGASPDAKVDLVIEVDGKLFKEAHANGYGVAVASGALDR